MKARCVAGVETDVPIGQLLVDVGLIDVAQLGVLAALQNAGDERPVSEVLIDLGYVTRAQLEDLSPSVARPVEDPSRERTAPARTNADGVAAPIGRILLESGLITVDELLQMVAMQRAGDERRLGDILVDSSNVTRAQVESAVAHGLRAEPILGFDAVERLVVDTDERESRVPIGQMLVTEGVITQRQLDVLVALQHAGDEATVIDALVDLGFATRAELDTFADRYALHRVG